MNGQEIPRVPLFKNIKGTFFFIKKKKSKRVSNNLLFYLFNR